MEPKFDSVKDGGGLPPCRNAWAVPLAKFVCARPIEISICFWLVVFLVIATAAKADPSLRDVEKRIDGFEKRMEDLEINLSNQIAAQHACPANSAIEVHDELKKPCEEVDYGHSFDDCMAKQGRFHMTKAEVEARLYSMWLCGHNQGIRWHNDP